jgi:anaerobic selenocysteine-containing dehydrogenase
MAEKKARKVDVSVDKVTIKNLAMGGLLGGGGECFVDVKDGKAIRIRPYKYDWKTDFEKLRPWTMERNGETLSPLAKALPAPFSLAYKKRTFSPNRVKFPMVRVDWDPNGERNTQNRGKSKYRRITWDEATDIIAAEIRRIHKQYGPLAILAQGDGHGENKTIHTPHGHQARLLDMMGGFTQQVRNPDSWEGW